MTQESQTNPFLKSPPDRRDTKRVEGDGMMVRIDRSLIEIMDVSLGGIRIERQPDLCVGQDLKMQLIPREGRKVLVDQSLPVVGNVVGVCEKWTRIRFASMDYKLAKFLVRHLSDRIGVKPFIVK